MESGKDQRGRTLDHPALARRVRRKFTAGALEQGAQILGATAASVLVVGLVGPYIAALAGPMHAPTGEFLGVAVLALLIAFGAATGAMVLRGLSRVANDDGRLDSPEPRR